MAKPWTNMNERLDRMERYNVGPATAGVPAVYRKAAGDLLARCRKELEARRAELGEALADSDVTVRVRAQVELADVEAALEFLKRPWPERAL